MDVLVPLPVALPLLAAALVAAVGYFLPAWFGDLVAALVSTAVTVVAVLLLARTGGHDLVYWFGGWRPSHGVALGIAFDVDRAGAALAALAALLTTASVVFSWRYFDETGPLFYVLLLVFLGAVEGFALSGDLFNLFVFLELMTVAAIALTGYGDEPGPLQGALNFGIVNGVGAFFLLFGIGLLYGRTGALNLAQIGRSLAGGRADGLVLVAFLLVTAGFLVKAGVVPFHFWLADAYAVAPAPVCVLYSGVMSDVGLHAVAKVYWPVFSGPLADHATALRAILVTLGVAGALLGGAMAFLQRDLKRMLAFVTIGQIGIGLVGIGLLTVPSLAGMTLYVVSDGLVRGSLLLVVGILVRRLRSCDELRARGQGLRSSGVVFAAGALAIAGLPPVGSFVGRALIVDGATSGYRWLPVVLTVASILSGAALLRAAGRIYLGWGADAEPVLGEEQVPAVEEEPAHAPRGSLAVMLASAAVLLVVGVVVAAWPGVRTKAELAAVRTLDRPAHAAEVLEGKPPPHVFVSTPALSATSIAAGLVSAAGAVALALLALFGGLGALGRPPVLRLKTLHSGVVTDYVTWATAGVAALGVAFVLALR
jgi:multicomponent Na+:H+ antiporter subunit D